MRGIVHVIISALTAVMLILVPAATSAQENFPPEPKACCITDGAHSRTWLTSGEPKALILCIHGLGLCSSGFEDFAEHMTARGFNCVAIDIHGFGNETEREPVDFDRTLVDLRSLLAKMRAHYPDKPIFIVGESLGGSMAIRLAALEDGKLAGIICSAPAWKVCKQKRTILKAVVSWFQPHERLTWIAEALMDEATHNPLLKQHWIEDPHHKLHMSPTEELELNKFVKRTPTFLSGVTHTPVLFVQRVNDRLVQPQAVAQMFASLPIRDKELLLINGTDHLIVEEGQGDGFTIEEIGKWIEGARMSLNAPQPTGALISSGEFSNEATRLFHLAKIDRPVLIKWPTPLNAGAEPATVH
jgi:alpha-beta hydrolase superfamily lysophospholipase